MTIDWMDRRLSERRLMATALRTIAEILDAPADCSVSSRLSLEAIIERVRQMREAEVRLASVLESLAAIADEMDKLAAPRPDDWDLKGYALAVRGVLIAGAKQEAGNDEQR